MSLCVYMQKRPMHNSYSSSYCTFVSQNQIKSISLACKPSFGIISGNKTEYRISLYKDLRAIYRLTDQYMQVSLSETKTEIGPTPKGTV